MAAIKGNLRLWQLFFQSQAATSPFSWNKPYFGTILLPVMSPLNVLIVEDNLSFALELEMLVDELRYQVLGRADSSGEALDLIFSKNPDLILMDIDIKGNLSGLEIGEKIAHLNIPVLYITALKDVDYEQAAKLPGTIGYLVKPVEKITLRTAINLAIEKAIALQADKSAEAAPVSENYFGRDYLFFKKKGTYHKVPFHEIAFVKSNDNYCDVHTTKAEIFIARISISKLEEMLPKHAFFRTHRQFIVQTSLIEQVNFQDNVLVVYQKEVPVSRENKKELEMMIHKLG